jgi:hypothetical protein
MWPGNADLPIGGPGLAAGVLDLKFTHTNDSAGDDFQRQAASARAEDPDRDHDGQHGNSDKGEDSRHAEIAQEKADQKTAEDRAQPAPGINEADRLRPHARGKKFRLVCVKREGHAIVRACQHHAAGDQPRGIPLFGKKQTGRGDANRAHNDLPFPFRAIRDAHRKQRSERSRKSNQEGIAQAQRRGDARRDHERGHPG